MQDAADARIASAKFRGPVQAFFRKRTDAYQKRRAQQGNNLAEMFEAGVFNGCHVRGRELVGREVGAEAHAPGSGPCGERRRKASHPGLRDRGRRLDDDVLLANELVDHERHAILADAGHDAIEHGGAR